MTRDLPMILALTALGCAEPLPTTLADMADDAAADPFAGVAGEQAAPPLDMDLWAFDLIRGRDLDVFVENGPANHNVVILGTANTTGTPACPNIIAPDCLSVASPYLVLGSGTTDANGSVVITLSIPAGLGPDLVRIQAASNDNGQVYLSGAPVLDVVDDTAVAGGINDLRLAGVEGDYHDVAGTVTGVSPFGFFMQQPGTLTDGGMWVYTGGSAVKPEVGDEVLATGYFRYFDNNGTLIDPLDTLTEIDLLFADGGRWTKIGGGTVPAPIPLTTDDIADPATAELYEGMLVTLDPGAALEVLSDPATDFGEFLVGAVTTPETCDIDNDLYSLPDNIPTFSVGDTFDTITGIVNFSFDEHKVAPRFAGDAVGYADAP